MIYWYHIRLKLLSIYRTLRDINIVPLIGLVIVLPVLILKSIESFNSMNLVLLNVYLNYYNTLYRTDVIYFKSIGLNHRPFAIAENICLSIPLLILLILTKNYIPIALLIPSTFIFSLLIKNTLAQGSTSGYSIVKHLTPYNYELITQDRFYFLQIYFIHLLTFALLLLANINNEINPIIILGIYATLTVLYTANAYSKPEDIYFTRLFRGEEKTLLLFKIKKYLAFYLSITLFTSAVAFFTLNKLPENLWLLFPFMAICSMMAGIATILAKYTAKNNPTLIKIFNSLVVVSFLSMAVTPYGVAILIILLIVFWKKAIKNLQPLFSND